MINRMFHTAIRTADPIRMRNFYTRLLDMVVDRRRPDSDVDVAGFWLRPGLPGGEAIIHVFAGEDAKTPDGRIPTGGAAVHHLSFLASGFHGTLRRIQEAGLNWRGNLLPSIGLWQIFVHDPNGILLELTFEAAVEDGPPPELTAAQRFDAQRLDWFDAGQYGQFAG
jgi:catechol 2,3-dioxygenase-like lactoylglutathione lyase family enzyme